MLTRATVVTTFQSGVTPTGEQIDVIDGSVTYDADADIRGTLDITVSEAWPIFADDLLAPYGNELFVEVGLPYNEDLVEWLGLGYFRIESPEQDIPTDSPIRLTGVDRMQGIIEARLIEPAQYLSGTTFGTIVSELILEVYPSATIDWDDATDTATLTRDIIVEDDRFGFLNEAIQSRGKIWFWDHRGILVIQDPPDDVAVYTIKHAESGTLVSLNRRLTRENTYNIVIASGEGADSVDPVRGLAVDDDPNSPTYIDGTFGRKPFFFTSPFIGTQAEAENAAEVMLQQLIGLTYDVSFQAIVNPALMPYDTVRLKYSYNESYRDLILRTLTIPLVVSSALEAQTREKRITLIGTDL